MLALGNKGAKRTSKKSSVSRFLGDSPNNNVGLAKKASTTTYVNKKTPPYIQLHCSLDKRVPLTQSKMLKQKLDQHSVINQLFVEDGAGHSDPVFDSKKYVPHVIQFIKQHLPNE